MNTTTNAARKTYAALRNAVASRISKADFDERAGRIAHELADGEEIEPSDWVQGARELVWELTGNVALCQMA